MKRILFVLMEVLVVILCRFSSRQTRNYFNDIASRSTAVALSPTTIYSPLMNRYVDFAIGTVSGDIYFGSLKDNPVLTRRSAVTKYNIMNLTWNDFTLQIVTPHEIKIEDMSKSYTNLLTMEFGQEIKNAVFGSTYDNTILIAISFLNRLEVYKEKKLVANITLEIPCFSMAFTTLGDELYFFSKRTNSSIFSLNSVNTSTGQIIQERTNFSYEQTSLAFVPDVWKKSLISSYSNKLVEWDDSGYIIWQYSNSFARMKMANTGDYVVGFILNSSYYQSSRIYIVNVHKQNAILLQSSVQTLSFVQNITDVAMRGNIIVCLCRSEYFQIFSSQNIPDDNNSWVFILFGIIAFVIVVAACASSARKRRLRRQRQIAQGAYVSQNDIATPIVPPPYIPPNQGFNQYQYYNQNQGFNQNVGFNNGSVPFVNPQLSPGVINNQNQGLNPYGGNPYNMQVNVDNSQNNWKNNNSPGQYYPH